MLLHPNSDVGYEFHGVAMLGINMTWFSLGNQVSLLVA